MPERILLVDDENIQAVDLTRLTQRLFDDSLVSESDKC